MRNAELRLGSGDDLDVRSFHVQEAMSAAFRIEVTARSSDDAIDLASLPGKPAAFVVRGGEEGDRAWTGVCSSAAQTGVSKEGLSTYSVQIVPALWLLTQRTNHRIFQHLAAPAIVEKILREHRIEPVVRLSREHAVLASRTQYGETDYDFVRRILAEAGISFFFETPSGKPTTVVLADAPEQAAPIAGSPVPFFADATSANVKASHVTDVQVSTRVVSTRATVRDFDFRRPRYALAGTHATEKGSALLEDYRYEQGATLAAGSTHGPEPVADARGAYRHQDALARARATQRAEAARAKQVQVEYATSRCDLAPGATFGVDGHPSPALARGEKLLVIASWMNGDVGAGWHGGGRAVPADRPFRPGMDDAEAEEEATARGPFEPLTATKKPRVHGVQSALVTGPAGQDVHTDEHGRVTVKFPWDRDAQDDDRSSPWVRVSHAWAGPSHGLHTVPRVGHEVLVAFHGGDPDQPTVVGRVHNAVAPVPYALPHAKTLTSIVTSSPLGPNEITFDDAKGQELFYMQAAGELHKIVKHDELEHTKGARDIHVDGDLVISATGTITLVGGGDVTVKGTPNVHVNPAKKPAPAKKPTPLTSKPASDDDPNAILAEMHTGASFTGESDRTAKEYEAYAKKYQADAIELGKQWHVPPALILALMCRESGFGTLLEANGWAPGGAYGILQTQGEASGGPDSLATMEQAMGIFNAKREEVAAAHPGWTPAQVLAGAVAGYNSGAGNVSTQPTNPSTWAQMDSGTASKYGDAGDYSRDVWNMAAWYASNLSW